MIPRGGQSGTLTFFWNRLLTGQHFKFRGGLVKKITLYDTVHWKPTSIQIIENIPLTSLVDIRILLKERASKETDFSPAIPCYHTRFQRAQHLNVSWPATIKRHPERPREISTRRSRDAQVHKVHEQSANVQYAVLSRDLPLGDLQVILDLANQ